MDKPVQNPPPDLLPEDREKQIAGAEPLVSVIVPVRNDPGNLRRCLAALSASTYRDFELIVVDDASTDDTAQVATELGARVLRRQERGGPGRARNQGAQVARGQYLFFVDADCCVQENTLGRIVGHFQAEASLDALFGSYDEQPGARNVLSQWRNLVHHYVHQRGGERASTFWAGCGAVKRALFLSMGGFDTERYDRPCIEDIELGVRLFKAGHHIALKKDVQVKHLKRWTLWGMVRTDVRDRGIPWAQLILREGKLPNDLNLRFSQRLAAILSALLVATIFVGALFHPTLLLLPALALLGVLTVDRWTYRGRVPDVLRELAAMLTAGGLAVGLHQWGVWGVAVLGMVLGVVLINWDFYCFFARTKHPLFATLIVPLHVLYYIYSGLAMALGIGSHLWRKHVATADKPKAQRATSAARGTSRFEDVEPAARPH